MLCAASLLGLPFPLPREGVSACPARAGLAGEGCGEQGGTFWHFYPFLSRPSGLPGADGVRVGASRPWPRGRAVEGEWRWHIEVETGWPGRPSAPAFIPRCAPSSGLQKALGLILPRSREQPCHRVQIQASSSGMKMPAFLAALYGRPSVSLQRDQVPPSCPVSSVLG